MLPQLTDSNHSVASKPVFVSIGTMCPPKISCVVCIFYDDYYVFRCIYTLQTACCHGIIYLTLRMSDIFSLLHLYDGLTLIDDSISYPWFYHVRQME